MINHDIRIPSLNQPGWLNGKYRRACFSFLGSAEVCYDSRGQPRNSDCLAWGPGGRNIFESTKVIGERHLAILKDQRGDFCWGVIYTLENEPPLYIVFHVYFPGCNLFLGGDVFFLGCCVFLKVGDLDQEVFRTEFLTTKIFIQKIVEQSVIQ